MISATNTELFVFFLSLCRARYQWKLHKAIKWVRSSCVSAYAYAYVYVATLFTCTLLCLLVLGLYELVTSLSFSIYWKSPDLIIGNIKIVKRYNIRFITFKKGWHYRSNSTQNAIPHDSGQVVQEVDGCGPWIHASGNNKLYTSWFFVVLQLQYKPSFQYYVQLYREVLYSSRIILVFWLTLNYDLLEVDLRIAVSLIFIKKVDSILPNTFSVINHRGRANVVRTSVTHEKIAECVTFLVIMIFWRQPRSITEQTHGNMAESSC